ncbi:MAG TPA: hypothetical protein VFT01_09085 [Homoserinimonas sp.]|nr:hypothetical protein [Homoserinimonas sp.]
MSESQKVTKQPALTTASGRTWLIVAGIISVLSLVFLWFMRELEPLGAAAIGMVMIIVIYLVMVAIRFGVRAPRMRLWSLAMLTIGIAITFLTIAVIMIYSA